MLAIKPACTFQEAVNGIAKQRLPLQWKNGIRLNVRML